MARPNGSSEMEKRSRGPLLRSLHSLALVAFGYPYVFVTLPLAALLAAHAVKSLYVGQGPEHPWTLSGLIHCGACLVGIIVFACLAVGHLLIVVFQGWRDEE